MITKVKEEYVQALRALADKLEEAKDLGAVLCGMYGHYPILSTYALNKESLTTILRTDISTVVTSVTHMLEALIRQQLVLASMHRNHALRPNDGLPRLNQLILIHDSSSALSAILRGARCLYTGISLFLPTGGRHDTPQNHHTLWLLPVWMRRADITCQIQRP